MLSISVYLSKTVIIKVLKVTFLGLSPGIAWGFGAHALPPFFRRAHPHVLTVKSGLVVQRVQCHSSTIGVGTSRWV